MSIAKHDTNIHKHSHKHEHKDITNTFYYTYIYEHKSILERIKEVLNGNRK